MPGLPAGTVKLDDGTRTFPYDISSFVRLAEPLSCTRGRPDENQTIQPGTLTLTLDNTDGRFTQGNATYHVQPDQGIRVTLGGVTFWTGRVQAWPVSWPGGDDTFSTVTITGTDDLARLSGWALRSALDEELAADGVAAHWPMNEGSGAHSAHDIIGLGAGPRLKVAHAAAVDFGGTPVAVDPVFGFSMGVVDGSTGILFTGTPGLNGFLYGSGGTFDTTGTGFHLEWLFNSNGPSAATNLVFVAIPNAAGPGGGQAPLRITYEGDGKVTFTGPLLGPIAFGSGLDDGLPHVVAVEAGTFGVDVYIDNVLVHHDTTLRSNFVFNLAEMFVGTCIATVGIGKMAMAHLNIGPPISSARVGVHYTTILSDYLGELPTDRLTRIGRYTGTPLATLDTAGFTTCSAATQAGKTALDVINEVAEATDGIVYTDGNGNLANVTGYSITQEDFASAILDAKWVGEDTQVQVDMLDVVNHADGHADGSQTIYTFVDPNSINGSGTNPPHGLYHKDYTWHVALDDLAGDRTSWKVLTFSQPFPRLPECTFDLLSMDSITLAQALTLDLGGFVEISNMPAQTPTGNQFLIVQGIKMTLSNNEWSLTINGTRHAQSAAWILGDGFFGVLGASTKLYSG